MNVKIKKLSKDSVLPTYSKAGDVGLDLTAISEEWNDRGFGSTGK